MSEEVDLNISKAKLAGYAILAVVLVIVFLPLLQELLYRVLIANPATVQWGLVAAVIAAIGVRRDDQALFAVALIVFVLFGLLIGPLAGSVYAHTHVANDMQQNADELDTLPNTSEENVRVLPRSVSDNYADSSMQYPQYGLSESDIAYRNGTYTWSYALEPDNFLVSLLGNQRGAVYVDMTTTNKSVEVEETQFASGRGQIFFDSYRYQSVLASPLRSHNWDTTFNAEANGQSYIAHSTTRHEWHFRLLPIPQFYAVPQHGSVEVMYRDGVIESLSPEEAHSSQLLEGQNYYPYDLAMYRVESMQYINGALNRWFWKEDVLAIADLPESGNSWPISVPTAGDGPELTYFVATEPTGSGNGVYEVWTFDGQTGEAGVQQYNESQIGPERAIDFVSQRQEVNRLSDADVITPTPVVQDGQLFWHIKVIPQSDSGIIYTAFVNAETGDVTLVEGTDPIYAFLSEGEVQQLEQEANTTSGSTVDVTVVVTDGSGNITRTEEITVPDDGNVGIEIADNSTSDGAGS